ncbi:unnamed protein product [Symbiodinium sp. KB8]|nr:unnamed protein product [Symbiodinium sp. KB8]
MSRFAEPRLLRGGCWALRCDPGEGLEGLALACKGASLDVLAVSESGYCCGHPSFREDAVPVDGQAFMKAVLRPSTLNSAMARKYLAQATQLELPAALAGLLVTPERLAKSEVETVALWASPGQTCCNAHCDDRHNLLCVARGCKTVVAVNPACVLPGMGRITEAGAANHCTAFAPARVLEELLAAAAAWQQARRPWEPAAGDEPGGAALAYVAHVGPGDGLELPAGWWHAVRSQAGTIAVSHWLRRPAPDPRSASGAPSCIRTAVSVMLEAEHSIAAAQVAAAARAAVEEAEAAVEAEAAEAAEGMAWAEAPPPPPPTALHDVEPAALRRERAAKRRSRRSHEEPAGKRHAGEEAGNPDQPVAGSTGEAGELVGLALQASGSGGGFLALLDSILTCDALRRPLAQWALRLAGPDLEALSAQLEGHGSDEPPACSCAAARQSSRGVSLPATRPRAEIMAQLYDALDSVGGPGAAYGLSVRMADACTTARRQHLRRVLELVGCDA